VDLDGRSAALTAISDAKSFACAERIGTASPASFAAPRAESAARRVDVGRHVGE
jgi:hypothetical protein